MNNELDYSLVRKYNKSLPRYTSYPSMPFWNEHIDKSRWDQHFKSRFEKENKAGGISLYIHLPFCESLCTYCGCNKKITTNHSVEEEYLNAIKKEWNTYRELMQQKPIIRELHLGGGTPTFFSPQNLRRLLEFIFANSVIHPQHEFSIEGHPNNTTPVHLQTLYDLGFRRISYGVQDNDPEVQRIINRIQPFENIKRATENARITGFHSVNFDLIYGLPLQTAESMYRTINKVLGLKPDRIAFYSYAHVPWVSKSQRLFDETNLPSPENKILLYLEGKELLKKNGYYDIGMDHFALPSDDLYAAWQSGKLHRNFMGYTTQHTGLLLGLGVSSISDTYDGFAQNEKSLHEYYAAVFQNELPVRKGFFLSDIDQRFRKYILDISCRGETRFRERDLPILQHYTFPSLEQYSNDNLVKWDHSMLQLTPKGHYFIRNICSAFDLYLGNPVDNKAVFSKTI